MDRAWGIPSIVYDLIDKNIGLESDLAIRKSSDPMQQNQVFHVVLLRKCTMDALKMVCDVIISVGGNPRMKEHVIHES